MSPCTAAVAADNTNSCSSDRSQHTVDNSCWVQTWLDRARVDGNDRVRGPKRSGFFFQYKLLRRNVDRDVGVPFSHRRKIDLLRRQNFNEIRTPMTMLTYFVSFLTLDTCPFSFAPCHLAR